jgi:hypothetical protein
MAMLNMNSGLCESRFEEEQILTSFTRRLIEIAVVSGAATCVTAMLDAMHLPAIAIDRQGYVADANAAAEVVFDDNIKIKDRRLFVRDVTARTLLKESVDQLTGPPHLDSLAMEPVIVPRMDKLPVIVRIWPFEGPSQPPEQEVRALLTLNALGPRPGPPAAIIAKTFRLTPSEAKLACIIARGAPPGGDGPLPLWGGIEKISSDPKISPAETAASLIYDEKRPPKWPPTISLAMTIADKLHRSLI